MFIRSLPFAIPNAFRTARFHARSIELVLLDTPLFAVALKVRVGR